MPSAEVADSDHVSKGAAARIKALDQLTSSTLRKSQVINKVSDVVRELVENALDAGATTIQVYLVSKSRQRVMQTWHKGCCFAVINCLILFSRTNTEKRKLRFEITELDLTQRT